MALSTQPPKGTSDWNPDEYRIRSYIFDTWRSVCKSYGYREYLTPIVEHAEVYRAKSGEDVGGAELVTFEDRAGRELCIRPEMTPSVTRMVSGMYESSPKPLRLFSIANFMRNERPQRGRNREFWQLNADMFGFEGIAADVEILTLAIDLMRAFGATDEHFQLRYSSRGIIDRALGIAQITSEQRGDVVRVLDKWEKLDEDHIRQKLKDLGCNDFAFGVIEQELFRHDPSGVFGVSDNDESQKYLSVLKKTLDNRGYGKYIKFSPEIIRGFDYYDGVIFEVFDLHKDNNRAMFGGGRYNGLADIFGRTPFPSIGFAPGDETMKLFLESWGLVDKIPQREDDVVYYAPLLDEDSGEYMHRVARSLRDRTPGVAVATGLKPQSVGKALQFATKGGYKYLVLAGSQEMADGVYIVKDLVSGEEERRTL